MLKKYFKVPENIPKYSAEYAKYQYIFGFSLLFEFVMFYFALYNFFITKIYTLTILEAISFILLTGILIDLKKRENILHASYAVVILIFLLLLAFDIFAIKSNYAFLWNFSLPLTAYYLLGSKRGTIVTLLFYSFFFYYIMSIINQDITEQAAVNIILSNLIFTGVLYTYESSREKNFKMLNLLLANEKHLSAQFKELSVIDKLTNIYNRVKLDEYLETIYKRATRYKEEFSIMIIDIDHFKDVNDTYGHLVGDEILIKFTQCIQKNIRASDILGRWGGEEFMLILPNTNCIEARTLAEHLRISIEKFNFNYKFSNSASFGIATFTDEKSEAKLIETADHALYAAKESGRNCVKSKKDLKTTI